jgi:hypothetical protein
MTYELSRGSRMLRSANEEESMKKMPFINQSFIRNL